MQNPVHEWSYVSIQGCIIIAACAKVNCGYDHPYSFFFFFFKKPHMLFNICSPAKQSGFLYPRLECVEHIKKTLLNWNKKHSFQSRFSLQPIHWNLSMVGFPEKQIKHITTYMYTSAYDMQMCTCIFTIFVYIYTHKSICFFFLRKYVHIPPLVPIFSLHLIDVFPLSNSPNTPFYQ